MTEHEINRAVALATGESELEIRHRGFGIADAFEIYFDPEPDNRPPLVLDWDEIYPYDPPPH